MSSVTLIRHNWERDSPWLGWECRRRPCAANTPDPYCNAGYGGCGTRVTDEQACSSTALRSGWGLYLVLDMIAAGVDEAYLAAAIRTELVE